MFSTVYLVIIMKRTRGTLHKINLMVATVMVKRMTLPFRTKTKTSATPNIMKRRKISRRTFTVEKGM